MRQIDSETSRQIESNGKVLGIITGGVKVSPDGTISGDTLKFTNEWRAVAEEKEKTEKRETEKTESHQVNKEVISEPYTKAVNALGKWFAITSICAVIILFVAARMVKRLGL